MATLPKWPDSLPVPMIEGYAAKARPTFARTEMDSGMARQRRRQVNGPTTFQGRWRMTALQMAMFDDWFENQAFGGAAWVSMPIYTGTGKTYVPCRFTDTPDKARVPDSGLWEVSAVIETNNRLVPNG